VSPILQKYKVLIVDPDIQMGKVVKSMLEGMGFSIIYTASNEDDAIDLIKEKSCDFVITEWNTQQKKSSSLQLVKRIRKDPESPNRALPIIMLTGRAEKHDVMIARDHGISEYVVKPFSARSLYARLERLFENPRDFVVSASFTGPERRIQKPLPEGVSDRRTQSATKNAKSFDPKQAVNDNRGAQIWAADFTLKEKLGHGIKLNALITPDTLIKAQESIDAISKDSILWIKDNLQDLKDMQKAMMQGNDILTNHAYNMGELALLISARSGTFGYQNASKVAYMLYLFCSNHLNPDKPLHCIIAEKHIEVLQVSLSDEAHKNQLDTDKEILEELKNLAEKYGT
jgi:two-component system, chemotaxis family, chemotaxis protein CheY